jgi:hypothetical protein
MFYSYVVPYASIGTPNCWVLSSHYNDVRDGFFHSHYNGLVRCSVAFVTVSFGSLHHLYCVIVCVPPCSVDIFLVPVLLLAYFQCSVGCPSKVTLIVCYVNLYVADITLMHLDPV